ncbi:MAG: 4-hydroxy-3-methylbut-2-enyl diphosphate reductase, partial [Clostridia bacterium]|nr:4-hydroxy-3-methylbut-2-enyl diphosphate reductase [Clostridia bacterium]
MKKIVLAESAGFCFGVKRSVEMAEKLLSSEGACASLGQLIHNDDVVHALEERGLRVIDSAAEAKSGEQVIVRAHGVAPAVYEALEEAGAQVTDATCPKVKAIHTIVQRAGDEGRFVIIIGMREHPEVVAIQGWCRDCAVFENANEVQEWLEKNENFWEKPITVVVQTTQTRNNFNECCEIIKKRCTNAKISDTICLATFTRQEEAASLAAGCDAMIVIGGKHSANSLHLAQICKEHCSNVQFIERTDELDLDRLQDADTVGLTAGASTPAWIIKEVRNKMSDEIKVEESTVEKELSFDEMLEETLKTIYNGDKVTGTVVAITGTEISVDLGAKYSGFIPTTEFTDDGVKVEDVVKVGDEIEAIVVRVNDVEGTAMLSKTRLDAAKVWTDIEE